MYVLRIGCAKQCRPSGYYRSFIFTEAINIVDTDDVAQAFAM